MFYIGSALLLFCLLLKVSKTELKSRIFFYLDTFFALPQFSLTNNSDTSFSYPAFCGCSVSGTCTRKD